MSNAGRNAFRVKSRPGKYDPWLISQAGSLRLNDQCDRLTSKLWGIASFRDLVWHELCSEYDSINFSRCLRTLNISISEEYLTFERAWLNDEWRHHSGFRFLYTHLFDTAESDVDSALKRRSESFLGLSEWLKDEFSVCVLLAYDEIVTAQAYRLDYPIYKTFNNGVLLKWISSVALDEVHHFSNAVGLIRHSHVDRLKELAPMLDRLVQRDVAGEGYQATFVLDHQGFPPRLFETARDCFLRKCAAPVQLAAGG